MTDKNKNDSLSHTVDWNDDRLFNVVDVRIILDSCASIDALTFSLSILLWMCIEKMSSIYIYENENIFFVDTILFTINQSFSISCYDSIVTCVNEIDLLNTCRHTPDSINLIKTLRETSHLNNRSSSECSTEKLQSSTNTSRKIE
jgi:hypothetical protein